MNRFFIFNYKANWGCGPEKARIIEVNGDALEVKNIAYVYLDENGIEKESLKDYGHNGLHADKAYRTLKELYDAMKIEKDNEVKKYCDAIKTLDDLIKFPLKHCLVGEEYTEWNAVEAYKIRAKELASVDLNIM